jgi:hypothetical protein
LKPDIQQADQGTKRKPLKRITVVFGDIQTGLGPCAPKLRIFWPDLYNRQREQGQAGFLAIRRQLDILPDDTAVGLAKRV